MERHAAVPQHGAARPAWIWPVRLPGVVADQLLGVAQWLGERVGSWPRWLLAGALAGAVPLLLQTASGLPVGRALTALLVTLLLLGAVARDWTGRGLTAVAAAFLIHNALAVALFAQDRARLTEGFPDGAAYWAQTHDWLLTGLSPEAALSGWLPAQAQLLAAVVLFSYTSLGFIPFWYGLYEVDLMNGYVAELLRHSHVPGTALALGWHPWSLCRGAGYLFLTFEVASLSLARLTGVRLSTPARRRRRWLAGLALLLLDGVLKYFLLEPVRRTLAANLV
jgi:hypothetical protein